jgi:hypothetical protein
VIVAGLQTSPLSDGAAGGGEGGSSGSDKLWDVPFTLATSTADVLTLTVEASAENPAVVAPGGTGTEDGTNTLAPPLATPVATGRPVGGAGLEMVTEHPAEPGVVSGVGAQASAVTA